MTRHFLYRRGDGNEGNFPHHILALSENENAYAALRALVINDYIPAGRVRRHIIRTIEVDGEVGYGLYATVYAGPDGEQAFGAAWLTAELQPLSDSELAFYADRATSTYTLKECLDRGAKRIYRMSAKD
jgi:hypothetical protein